MYLLWVHLTYTLYISFTFTYTYSDDNNDLNSCPATFPHKTRQSVSLSLSFAAVADCVHCFLFSYNASANNPVFKTRLFCALMMMERKKEQETCFFPIKTNQLHCCHYKAILICNQFMGFCTYSMHSAMISFQCLKQHCKPVVLCKPEQESKYVDLQF